MIRILLVDDQVNVLQGLKMRLELESGLQIVGEALSGFDAIEQVQKLKPDVVIMDIKMPGMDGITTTRKLHATNPELPVIVLSILDDPETKWKVLLAGGEALIAKKGGLEQLLETIQNAVHPADD